MNSKTIVVWVEGGTAPMMVKMWDPAPPSSVSDAQQRVFRLLDPSGSFVSAATHHLSLTLHSGDTALLVAVPQLDQTSMITVKRGPAPVAPPPAASLLPAPPSSMMRPPPAVAPTVTPSAPSNSMFPPPPTASAAPPATLPPPPPAGASFGTQAAPAHPSKDLAASITKMYRRRSSSSESQSERHDRRRRSTTSRRDQSNAMPQFNGAGPTSGGKMNVGDRLRQLQEKVRGNAPVVRSMRSNSRDAQPERQRAPERRRSRTPPPQQSEKDKYAEFQIDLEQFFDRSVSGNCQMLDFMEYFITKLRYDRKKLFTYLDYAVEDGLVKRYITPRSRDEDDLRGTWTVQLEQGSGRTVRLPVLDTPRDRLRFIVPLAKDLSRQLFKNERGIEVSGCHKNYFVSEVMLRGFTRDEAEGIIEDCNADRWLRFKSLPEHRAPRMKLTDEAREEY